MLFVIRVTLQYNHKLISQILKEQATDLYFNVQTFETDFPFIYFIFNFEYCLIIFIILKAVHRNSFSSIRILIQFQINSE